MTPADLAIELDLDRAEAMATPAWLTSPAASHLHARASASPEPALRVRATTLHRWMRAAHLASFSGPRPLAGLASRHAALVATAHRLGITPRVLISDIHGRIPDTWGQVPVDNATSSTLGTPEPVPGRIPDDRIPDAAMLVEVLARAHGLETVGLAWGEARASSTVTLAPGHARMEIGAASDAMAALALAMHEAGHGLYRAQQAGMSALAAMAPARWFDEAIAAWAVRVIEDPAYVEDEEVRRFAMERRVRREEVTVRLAEFEEAVLGGEAVGVAWAQTGLRDPAAFPALFDEPGVMASYVAADRARLEPQSGELRAWARAGAALDVDALIA